MPQADANCCVGALCRLGLQALGWVYSAAGKRGGGGLRKLDGELHRHRREASEECRGLPSPIFGGESPRCCFKVGQGEVVSTGTAQEWLRSAPRAGKQGPHMGHPISIPMVFSGQNKSSWKPHIFRRRNFKQKKLSSRTSFGRKIFAFAVGNLKGFGMSGFVSGPHVGMR